MNCNESLQFEEFLKEPSYIGDAAKTIPRVRAAETSDANCNALAQCGKRGFVHLIVAYIYRKSMIAQASKLLSGGHAFVFERARENFPHFLAVRDPEALRKRLDDLIQPKTTEQDVGRGSAPVMNRDCILLVLDPHAADVSEADLKASH